MFCCCCTIVSITSLGGKFGKTDPVRHAYLRSNIRGGWGSILVDFPLKGSG